MIPPFIEYHITDIHRIELIRTLWIQLNEHHRSHAGAFQDHYRQWTFDDRREYFLKIAAAGSLRSDLARDPRSGRYIGYCVTSFSKDREGEIESVFVEEAYRSQGVGATLVGKALAWLTENGAIRNRVSVADGNEEAFPFYRKFGFFPRMTVLEQKKDCP